MHCGCLGLSFLASLQLSELARDCYPRWPPILWFRIPSTSIWLCDIPPTIALNGYGNLGLYIPEVVASMALAHASGPTCAVLHLGFDFSRVQPAKRDGPCRNHGRTAGAVRADDCSSRGQEEEDVGVALF